MLQGSELALRIFASAGSIAALGHLLTSIDRWAHSPARLKNDIDAINRRLDKGNEEFSKGMSKITTKFEQVDTHISSADSRISYIEGVLSHSVDTPRPRTR